MGAEDRLLVEVYREQVKEAGALLANSLWTDNQLPINTSAPQRVTDRESSRHLQVGDLNPLARPV
jgi:hypothetical protein